MYFLSSKNVHVSIYLVFLCGGWKNQSLSDRVEFQDIYYIMNDFKMLKKFNRGYEKRLAEFDKCSNGDMAE